MSDDFDDIKLVPDTHILLNELDPNDPKYSEDEKRKIIEAKKKVSLEIEALAASCGFFPVD